MLIAIIPRAMPWARSFCPFRACCFWSLGLQPVLKPIAKLEFLKHFSLSLYPLLYIIRKLREEIVAGDTFYFIY